MRTQKCHRPGFLTLEAALGFGLLATCVLLVTQLVTWGLAERRRCQVQQGALYPALHRLEQQGWIRAEWGESENRRRAKFYSLTAPGRAYLEAERANWQRLSAAIDLVLEGG